jgi:hypothetical protein
MAGVDTVAEYSFVTLFGTASEEAEFSWGANFAKNFGINLVTAGFGNKAKWVGKLGSSVFGRTVSRESAEFLTRQALEYSVDVGAGTAFDTLYLGKDLQTSFESNAIGSAVGRSISLGISRAFSPGRSLLSDSPISTRSSGLLPVLNSRFDVADEFLDGVGVQRVCFVADTPVAVAFEQPTMHAADWSQPAEPEEPANRWWIVAGIASLMTESVGDLTSDWRTTATLERLMSLMMLITLTLANSAKRCQSVRWKRVERPSLSDG